ncbi:hypothetical protein [Streptomyces pseudovenezuelae]|uniref:hypothetical protein n=1 Tax=Streptomyces pseudovenezuelae TaxID=67350 RepID=UPI0036EE6486
MPKKSDRRVPLPAGLLPLLTQPELETYYGVSDWTVLKWIEAGMPVQRLKTTGEQKKEVRRFDLLEVQGWMAEQDQLAATA